MAAAVDYTPRPGSIADRAYLELEARGERSASALADAIDVEASSINPCLNVAVTHGYIKRTKRDGLNWYSVGDGVPPAKAAPADDEPDDDGEGARAVQRVVPARDAVPMVVQHVAAPPAVPARTRAPNGNFDPEPPPAKAGDASPFGARGPLRVAQWSDGAVQIYRGDKLVLDLDADEGGALEAYFAR